METRINTKIAIFVAIIVFGVVSRLVPHLDNFAPMTALSLLGVVYLSRRVALLTPLVMMVISDLIIGLHDTVIFTWGSYILIAFIGSLIYKRTHKQVSLVLFSPLAAVLFFLITNFGVWVQGSLYPRTWAGLVQCFVLAVPFFRGTLLSDVLYTPLVFIAVALIVKAGLVAGTKLKSASV